MRIKASSLKIWHLFNLHLIENTERDILKSLNNLSWVQIDAIYVIARSQDLVLHARNSNYKEEGIWDCVTQSKAFEGFAHARSIIPIDHYPYYYTKMIRYRSHVTEWIREVADAKKWQEKVLKLVENEGPITTKDIQVPDKFPNYTGWSTSSKRLLDYLFVRGFLSIAKRERFQLFYDLPEKVIPNFDKITSNLPNREEEFKFHLKTTLQAVGPSNLHRLLHYKYLNRKITIDGKSTNSKTLVKKFVKEGFLSKIKLENQEKEVYCLPGQLEKYYDLPNHEDIEAKVSFLSPFDNALWSREALEEQYNYYYKLECYTPVNKRIYGFFSLPILYGIDFIGRVDPSLDRKNGVFYFKQWSWESKFSPRKQFFEQLATTISEFTKFHGVNQISLGDLKSSFRKRLMKEFDNSTLQIRKE